MKFKTKLTEGRNGVQKNLKLQFILNAIVYIMNKKEENSHYTTKTQ